MDRKTQLNLWYLVAAVLALFLTQVEVRQEKLVMPSG
jgi:hypothetical protein